MPVVVVPVEVLFRTDLVVMDLTDHLVVVPVVVLEQVLDLVVRHHLSQHHKVAMVDLLVVVQTILLVLMDLVEVAVLVLLVVMDQVLNQERVVLEFRYQIFQLLSEIVDTLVVVEQVVKHNLDLDLELVVPVEVVIKVQDLVWMVNLALVVGDVVEVVLGHQPQVAAEVVE